MNTHRIKLCTKLLFKLTNLNVSINVHVMSWKVSNYFWFRTFSLEPVSQMMKLHDEYFRFISWSVCFGLSPTQIAFNIGWYNLIFIRLHKRRFIIYPTYKTTAVFKLTHLVFQPTHTHITHTDHLKLCWRYKLQENSTPHSNVTW